MVTSETTEQLRASRDWRFYVGLLLFILHLILPLIALLILPSLQLDQGTHSVLLGLSFVGGPDALLIAAAALLGKDNLEFLFSKLGGGFKRLVKWDQVSPKRYRTGVWIFWLSIVAGFVIFYLFPSTLVSAGRAGWGAYALFVTDILFVVSFFVLGAEFWGKLQGLFQYEALVAGPRAPAAVADAVGACAVPRIRRSLPKGRAISGCNDVLGSLNLRKVSQNLPDSLGWFHGTRVFTTIRGTELTE